MDVEELIDELIEREGGYANHPADRGGPTRFGITEAVARAHGYARSDGRAASRARLPPFTAGFTGCGRSSTRSPGARPGLPPSCSIPAPTWGRQSPPLSSSGR